MAKYRVIYQPSKVYEGVVQKKIFNCFWITIHESFSSERAKRWLNQKETGKKIIYETEF